MRTKEDYTIYVVIAMVISLLVLFSLDVIKAKPTVGVGRIAGKLYKPSTHETYTTHHDGKSEVRDEYRSEEYALVLVVGNQTWRQVVDLSTWARFENGDTVKVSWDDGYLARYHVSIVPLRVER